MSVGLFRPVPVARRLFVLGVVAAFCGCQKEEEITHYKVPKPENPPLPVRADKSMQRLFGAIVPRGDELWVFKLIGPEGAVTPHQAEFEAFIDSVKFGDGAKSPDYKVPEKWRAAKRPQFSMAAYHVGTEEDAPVLTVTPARGSVVDNIERWRGQLGLKPGDADEIKRTMKEKKIGDATAVLVDLTGTGSGKMAGSPPFAGKAHPPIPPADKSAPPAKAEPAATRLKYTLPSGWQEGGELVRAGIRREAVFQVRNSGQTAEVSVTMAGGGLKANVDRWRGQVGLPPWTEEQFKKEATPLMIGDSPAVLVDLSGDGKSDHQGILGAVAQRPGETWFFKMTGPADLIFRQKSAFEAFLKSVRFPGDAAHE
jgi:hypothetical protein